MQNQYRFFLMSILMYLLYENFYSLLARISHYLLIYLETSISTYVIFLVMSCIISLGLLFLLYKRVLQKEEIIHSNSIYYLLTGIGVMALLTGGINRLIAEFAENLDQPEVVENIVVTQKYNNYFFFIATAIAIIYLIFKSKNSFSNG